MLRHKVAVSSRAKERERGKKQTVITGPVGESQGIQRGRSGRVTEQDLVIDGLRSGSGRTPAINQ